MNLSRLVLALGTLPLFASSAPAQDAEERPIESISALAFGPDGTLFLGDNVAGAVHALDLGERTERGGNGEFALLDVEGKIAALLGTGPDKVLIHDLAVDPVPQDVYLAVSLEREKHSNAWQTANDVADATILLRVSPGRELTLVEHAALPRTYLP